EEVAAGESVAFAEDLVDLGDEAVYAIGGEGGGLCGFAAEVGRGERVAGENAGDYGIDDPAVVGGGLGDVCVGGYGGDGGDADVFALAFIGAEEEGFVADDFAADGAAELVVVEGVLLDGFRVEEVAGVEGVVAEEFVDAAVEVVGAGAGDEVDDGAGIA